MVCVGRWFEDGVPDHGQDEATVQVHVWDGFPDLDGFHSSPQPEPFHPSLDCCAFPVDAVVVLLDLNCNAVIGVSRFTAYLCSLNLTFSVLLVSPMYTSGHSLQGISYTTPACFCSGFLFFTCISSPFGVVLGLNIGFTPRGHRSSQASHLAPLCRGCTVSWVRIIQLFWFRESYWERQWVGCLFATTPCADISPSH